MAPTYRRPHVLPVVCDFLACYPGDIDARMVLSDGNVSLIDDHIDLGVRIGALPDSSTMAICVGAVRRGSAAAWGFFAAHGTPQKLDHLAGLPGATFAGTARGTPGLSRMAAAGRGRRRSRAPCRQHRRSGARCRHQGHRPDARAVLSRPRAPCVRATCASLAKFEPAPTPVSPLHAGEDLVALRFAVPRFRGPAPAQSAERRRARHVRLLTG